MPSSNPKKTCTNMVKLFPKELFAVVYAPGRQLVEVVVVAENRPACLANITRKIADMGVNILSSIVLALPHEENGVFAGLIDLTDTQLTVGDVARRLSALNVVKEVHVAEPLFNGFIVDKFCFPLTVGRRRHIVIGVPSFASIADRMFERLGTGGAVILYEMGFAMGEAKVERVTRELGLVGRRLVEAVLAERFTKGWCIPELTREDSEKGIWIIKAYELFECAPYKGKLKEPRSHFFRGYLAGLIRKTYNYKHASCTETKCIATGAEYCEFTITAE